MFLVLCKTSSCKTFLYNVCSRDQKAFTLINSARIKFKNSQLFSSKRVWCYKFIVNSIFRLFSNTFFSYLITV